MDADMDKKSYNVFKTKGEPVLPSHVIVEKYVPTHELRQSYHIHTNNTTDTRNALAEDDGVMTCEINEKIYRYVHTYQNSRSKQWQQHCTPFLQVNANGNSLFSAIAKHTCRHTLSNMKWFMK